MPVTPSLDEFIAESPVHRRVIAAFVRDFATALPPGTRMLDAGAGVAPYRSMFAHCHYRTQDWSRSPHGAGAYADVIGDLEAGLPLEGSSFDAILCTEVLEHVADAERVLLELRRLLRTGGRLAVTVPFVGPLHEEPHDHRRLTNHGLIRLLQHAGFGELEVLPLTGWFSTLAQVLRDQGVSTQRPEAAPALLQRLVGFGFLLMSAALRRVAPVLDRRLDSRRALPLGWAAVATAVDARC